MSRTSERARGDIGGEKVCFWTMDMVIYWFVDVYLLLAREGL